MLYLNLFTVFTLFTFILSANRAGAYSEDPLVANINISQFDTTGWHNVSGKDTRYARFYVREFDTVYMIPEERKYIFKAYFVDERKGTLIFDNLHTKFGEDVKEENPFNVTWRWYSYKIKFLWEDDVITVTTWF